MSIKSLDVFIHEFKVLESYLDSMLKNDLQDLRRDLLGFHM